MPVSTRQSKSTTKQVEQEDEVADTTSAKPPLAPRKKKKKANKKKGSENGTTGLTDLEDAQLIVHIEAHPGFQWQDLLNQYPSIYRACSEQRQVSFRNRFQYVKRVIKPRSLTEWSDLYISSRKLVEASKITPTVIPLPARTKASGESHVSLRRGLWLFVTDVEIPCTLSLVLLPLFQYRTCAPGNRMGMVFRSR